MEVVLGGRVWRLSPLTLGLLAETERHIQSIRPNPLMDAAQAVAGLSPALQAAAIAEATKAMAGRDNRVTLDDFQEFMSGFHGQLFLFWLAARRNHSELRDLGAVESVACDWSLADSAVLMDAILRVSGLEALSSAVKNSPSPATQTETTPGDPHESRGLESISVSAPSTVGLAAK